MNPDSPSPTTPPTPTPSAPHPSPSTPPSEPGQPLFRPPFQPPNPNQTIQPVVSSTGPNGGLPESRPKSKLPLIIGGAALALVILIVIIVVALTGNKSNKPTSTTQSTAKSQQSDGPQAATSNSVQLTNDSISQDISGLNDDKELPPNPLSNENLNL